jgi:hypothetical protein
MRPAVQVVALTAHLIKTGDTIMSIKTKNAIAIALILGGASAALANDIETNPSTAQSEREWAGYLRGQSHVGAPDTNYGSVVLPRELRKKSSGR